MVRARVDRIDDATGSISCRCILFAISWGLGISCTLRDFTNLPYHCPIAHASADARFPFWITVVPTPSLCQVPS